MCLGHVFSEGSASSGCRLTLARWIPRLKFVPDLDPPIWLICMEALMRHLFTSKRSCFASISWRTCFAIVLLPLMSGCSHFTGSLCDLGSPVSRMKGECRDERRARSAAREVWNNKYESCYVNHCDPKGLRNGFIDGFVDAAHGKTNCPPMFAPVNHGLFLHPKSSCSMAWHNGYPMGQAAALSCGFKLNCCSRLHPCLRSYERPVNPGCVKIDSYQATQQNNYSPSVPMEVVPPAAPIMPPIDVGKSDNSVKAVDRLAASADQTDLDIAPNEALVNMISQVSQFSEVPTFIKADTQPSDRTSGMMESFVRSTSAVDETSPATNAVEDPAGDDGVETSIDSKVENHWKSLPRTRSALGELNSTFNWRASQTP